MPAPGAGSMAHQSSKGMSNETAIRSSLMVIQPVPSR